jgi:tyrosine decarboxylase/aspartate 1-decarboxylase
MENGMILEKSDMKYLMDALETLEGGFVHLDPRMTSMDNKRISAILNEVATRMQDNYPYFHPYYAGQMLKPPHPIARLAYMLSMWINPNNHALDGGRASSYMEREAIADLAQMFNWSKHLGHLCSGGTMANLEALWISGKLNSDALIVASDQAHYTHHRISDVLQLPFRSIQCDQNARMDMNVLEDVCKKQNVGTVVATMGTTGTGSVDPLADILELQNKFGFRIHADAAYGGYFILADNLTPSTYRNINLLSQVDSIVIDPHKHGLQPYGAGCILFRDPSVGRFYKHDSPYTYFSSDELHLGEITLECSRPGASAVALWATQRMFPLEKGSEFATNLSNCRRAALKLYGYLQSDNRFLTVSEPELDIVIWALKDITSNKISKKSKNFFHAAAQHDLHLAVLNFPAAILSHFWPDVTFESETVTCLRSCLMKEEHLEWIDKIWDKIICTCDQLGF